MKAYIHILSIPELHKQLREYEATHPLPQLTAPELPTYGPNTASKRFNDMLPSEEPLPELHAGLTYPKDEEKLRWLSKYAPSAINALRHIPGDYSQEMETARENFQTLRRVAREHGRADEELITSILLFSKQRGKDLQLLPKDQLIAAVISSLKAASVAETAATDATSNTCASQALPDEDDLSGDRKRHQLAAAAVSHIHQLLTTDFAGLRITPTQAAELCNRIQMHATLSEE